jgi:hypothetical protein
LATGVAAATSPPTVADATITPATVTIFATIDPTATATAVDITTLVTRIHTPLWPLLLLLLLPVRVLPLLLLLGWEAGCTLSLVIHLGLWFPLGAAAAAVLLLLLAPPPAGLAVVA